MQKLGDIATYINGYAFKPADRGLKGLPIIRIQDLTGNSYDLGFYDGIYPKKIEINNGDILISWSGSLGIFLWNGGKALLNQHIFKVVFDKKDIDKHYFLFAVKEKLNEMSLKTHGATMKHIIKSDFENITISLPDLNEQKRISNMLLKIENLIKMRKNQIQHYDTLTKSLFVEMFGDPVISSNGKKQVPFSEFIASIRYGTSQPPVFSTNGEFKFIRATNIKKGKIIPKDMLRIDAIEANKIKKCQLTGNEIIIVRSGVNAGDTGIITSQYIGDYAGYDIIVSIDLKKGNPVYFNELINTHYMEQIIKPLTIRSAQPHLNAQQVKELPMVLATLEEQNNFAEVIEQIDKHKSVVQKSLDETQILFDSLMQKYFG